MQPLQKENHLNIDSSTFKYILQTIIYGLVLRSYTNAHARPNITTLNFATNDIESL